ncbi:MAG: gamma-glutamylcyclotransferase [Erysipelotrichaceae bacterium]|nr:gamma-glutamylcyclotransferase [Erysipelotrichaceae bacterium]
MIYFAYGSNHNLTQIKQRCPDVKVIGHSVLSDVQLIFIGDKKHEAYASLAMKEGAETPITLYELSESDLKSLDHYEGVEHALYRKEKWPIRFNGQRIEGMIYLKTSGVYHTPSEAYLKKIMDGYKDQGFDLKAIYIALDLSEKHEGQPCLNKI